MHGKHHQQQMAAAAAPKGCVTVRVGLEGEEQRRFAVPLGHLKHPLFGALLEEAEREYGFRHQGAIAIPCRVDRFVQVEHLIGQDLHGTCAQHLVDLDGGAGAPAPAALRRLLPRLTTAHRGARCSFWLVDQLLV